MKKKKIQVCLVLLTLILSDLISMPRVYANTQKVLKSYMETLEVGEPTYYQNLTIIPIYANTKKHQISYMTLDEAIKYNMIKITEVDGGNVPKVHISNLSQEKIYLMGGEIISGGKQDRIIGRDVLLRPKIRDIIVPVYCTEEGRWYHESKQFYSKKNLGTWRMRASAQYASETAQSEIWGDISTTSRKTGVALQTKAYQEIYDDHNIQKKIQAHEDRFYNIPELYADAIGVIIGIGHRIISVDVFTSQNLFQKLWPKILKSAALSAVSSNEKGSINEQDAIKTLRLIHDDSYHLKSAIDLGNELSVNNRVINTNALIYQNHVVHLSAFPKAQTFYKFKSTQDNDRRIPVMQR